MLCAVASAAFVQYSAQKRYANVVVVAVRASGLGSLGA